MTFAHRLKLYAFGFIMGLFILGLILKGKQCSGPNEIKMDELRLQKTEWTEKARCQLSCLGLSDKVFKTELSKCRINYDKSEVRAKPFGIYFIEGRSPQSVGFTAVIEDCDSLSKIKEITVLNKTCNCGS